MTNSEELNERERIATERTAQQEGEIALERADTAMKAAAIWRTAIAAKPDHPYLVRKKINPVPSLREIDTGAAMAILGYAAKSSGDLLAGSLLVVPVKKDDHLSTLELIDGDGRKTALAGRGSKAGGYWAAQPLPNNPDILLIGEGIATVLSVNEATRYPTIASLSAGNLPTVAKAMRKRYPATELVILTDLVKSTGAPDPHEIEAAQSVGGKLAVPNFGADREGGMTDFNDLTCIAEVKP